MFVYIGFLFLCLKFGNVLQEEISPIYIPKELPSTGEEDASKEDARYCYHFTWLGEKYDNNTFNEVMNKTCMDHFGKNDPTLCVDPMVVTFSGRKPDMDYIRKYHFREVTRKLPEDRVCAKYTIYYNGVASHVVRYCTRIDVISEGPLRSGCLTEKNGSSEYEVCACISGYGEGGICNTSTNCHTPIFIVTTLFMLCLLLHDLNYFFNNFN